MTRQNVRWRFARVFEEMPDLRGRRVLDLGCGSGRYLVEALERGADHVVGVDFAPEMLELAAALIDRQGGSMRTDLVCEDITRFDPQQRFDLVIANGLFDYLAPAEPVIQSAAAWCRGVFVASFPDKRAFRALPRRLYWRRRGVDIHAFGREEIEDLGQGAAFTTCSVERMGPLYLLVARA